MNQLILLDKNKNIKDLTVLLRVDFNVPLQNKIVSDSTKIIKVKDIINNRYKGTEVTDPISSVCEALKVLEVKKIGFVSPYVESVSTEMRGFLVGHGFDVKPLISFEQGSESVVASIKQSDTLKAVVEAATHDVDAIFVSCTNLKTFAILDQAEAIIGKPVLSSNQVLAWSMLRMAQVCMSKVEWKKCPGIIFDQKFF